MAQIVGILPGTMNPAAAIDVIIVNYNSGRALSECINSMHELNSAEIKIWVVDNASDDDSLLSLAQYNQLEIIRNTENLGFAKACNQGAQLGQAPMVAFINPDCFITSDQLKSLSAGLFNTPEAVLIGCRVLNEDGSLQPASRRRPPTFWRIVFHMSRLSRFSLFPGININDDGCFDEIIHVDAVNGSCLLMKRSAFKQVQGFDEGYPLHFEDLDLFARLQHINGTILYDSQIEVCHLKGHSKQDSKQLKKWKKLGLIRYFQQHRPRWESVLIKFLLALR